MFFVTGEDGTEGEPVPWETLVAWARTGRLAPEMSVRREGASPVPAVQIPELAEVFQQKGTVLIPTRNPAALWGYYLGFLSLVPMIGVAAVPFGLWKSLEGLRVHQRDPGVHGKIHSIIGLVLGIGGLTVQLLVIGAIVNMIIAGAGNN